MADPVDLRQRHGLDELAGTAVTIQLMIPAEVDGVVFTRDPDDPESELMLVENFR